MSFSSHIKPFLNFMTVNHAVKNVSQRHSLRIFRTKYAYENETLGCMIELTTDVLSDDSIYLLKRTSPGGLEKKKALLVSSIGS